MAPLPILVGTVAALLLPSHPRCAAALAPRRGAAPQLNWFDAQKRRREEQTAAFAEQVEKEKKAKAERAKTLEADAKERAQQKAAKNQAEADYYDSLDWRDSIGGAAKQPTNLLTREGIANSMKASSPAILAEERMQAAMEAAGGAATAAEAAATLRAAVENAREAGVNEMSSIMKKCTALLGAVELAAGGDFEAGMAALGDSPDSADGGAKANGGGTPQARAPGTPAPPAPKTADAMSESDVAGAIFADEFFIDED